MKYMANGSCGVVFAMICAALLLPLSVKAEQIDASQFRRSFNIAFPGYAGTTTLADFPVLVRLSPELNDFQYDKCADGGGDLRFADADGNLLAHEIDTWDPNGVSLVWVKVPSLDTTTVISAYYGYKGSGGPSAVAASDVWSNGYVGVWHLGETGLDFPDSTPNGLDFSCQQNHADYVGRGVENGAVGKSVEFGLDGSTAGCLLADDSDLLDGFQSVTFEFWTYQTTHTPGRTMALLKKEDSGGTYPFRFYQSNNDPRTLVAFMLDGCEGAFWANAGKGSGTLSLDQWNYQAYTYNWQYSATQARSYGYLNGSQIASRATNDVHLAFLSNDGKLCLGNEKAAGSNAYVGRMDEFRISNVARSAEWLKATFDTVNNDEFAVYSVPNDWTKYSHKFSVSFPGATNGVLSSFPVLVRVSEYDETTGTGIRGFSYADCLKANGGDLRFSDADGNLLDSEVDTWNPTGESLVWVNVPALSTDTKITAYYGWEFAPSVDSMNVWSNGYVGVWHLGEMALPLKDSTVNPANFVSDRNSVTYGQVGVVGGSPRFLVDENTNCLVMTSAADSGKLNGGAAITIEAWTCQYWHKSSPETPGYILAKDNGGKGCSYLLYEDNEAESSSCRNLKLYQDGVSRTKTVKSSTGLVPFSADEDIWNYQVFSYDSASEATKKGSYYLNGVLNNTSDVGSAPITNSVSQLYLGNAHNYAKYGHAFPGKIDEVRISNVARSAGWLATTYDMIKGNANFAAYSAAKEQLNGLTVIIR